MNALELQGLTKHYKDFTLGPLDLTLPGGTICGLIGENGAGKSTTIRLILDMVQRDGGTVTILGRDSRTASVTGTLPPMRSCAKSSACRTKSNTRTTPPA